MASLQPKNSGGPITKFWEAPEIISALEHVKGWLCKHAKKVWLKNKFYFPCFQGGVRSPSPATVFTWTRKMSFLSFPACPKRSTYRQIFIVIDFSNDSIPRRPIGESVQRAQVCETARPALPGLHT